MAEQDKEMQDKPQPKAGGVTGDNKRTRERPKLTEENYRTIFENSAVAITVSNKDEKIVSWNKFAEALLGMDEDDLYLCSGSLRGR